MNMTRFIIHFIADEHWIVSSLGILLINCEPSYLCALMYLDMHFCGVYLVKLPVHLDMHFWGVYLVKLPVHE